MKQQSKAGLAAVFINSIFDIACLPRSADENFIIHNNFSTFFSS